MPQSIILIPARLGSTRLPNKPLAMIGDVPMIVHVWRRAIEAKSGRVVVACDDEAIASAIKAEGGEAVMTASHHPSGSDRIFEAIEHIDSHKTYDIIINMQGDLPTLDPALLTELLIPFSDPCTEISTLAALIKEESEKTNPSIVKPIIAFESEKQGRALYFTRAAVPYGEGALYHHIGLYAYRREALEKFVSLPPSPLEQREKLEQLRALEAGMHIKVRVVDTLPLGVDTQEDLEKARRFLCTD